MFVNFFIAIPKCSRVGDIRFDAVYRYLNSLSVGGWLRGKGHQNEDCAKAMPFSRPCVTSRSIRPLEIRTVHCCGLHHVEDGFAYPQEFLGD